MRRKSREEKSDLRGEEDKERERERKDKEDRDRKEVRQTSREKAIH